MRIAKLNSPEIFGLSHVNVPELTSTETPVGKVYPGIEAPSEPFPSTRMKAKLSPS